MSPETLTDLQNQLTQVKTAIKNGGISSALNTELMMNQNLLQQWVDKIVTGSVVSPEELASMSGTLADAKKKVLEADVQRTKRTFFIIMGGLLLLTGGVIFYFKMKKK